MYLPMLTFFTQYGSNHNQFKVGQKEYNMPMGIAHFFRAQNI